MKALSRYIQDNPTMNILTCQRILLSVYLRNTEAVFKRRLSLLTTATVIAMSPAVSQAIDFGPDGMFSITGFAKVETQVGNNHCPDCQWTREDNKQRVWADAVIPGAPIKTEVKTVSLIQPYFGAKYDLGGGFKASGLLSQRWRDGKVDIKGYWYDKNIALSHEDYGSLRVGSMTTRAWSVADYPYGTDVGLADVWGSSGAGYGLLGRAVRYTSRVFDVASGDLVLEATYDSGNTDFKINKPRFVELYAQYRRGDLVIDAMAQDSRNGNPQSWSHGPFSSLTPNASDDAKLGGSSQGMAMAMARYQINSKVEVSGGIRRNRWSGAYAVITQPGVNAQWNNMFNVDWGGTLNGVANPGYSATSTDVMLGSRYRMGQWIASAGLAYLGKANTSNPSERGQSNAATVGALGLNYTVGNGLQFYGLAGAIHFSRTGLSPLAFPGTTAFTGVDPRVTRNGNWLGAGVVYVF